MKLLDNQKNLQDNIYLKEKKNLNLEKKIQIINQRDNSIKSASQNQIQKNMKVKFKKLKKKKKKCLMKENNIKIY